ncbi:MAG: radical SAM family heme chaperone HemW [Bacillota bacterium]|nr:radical SAM family heme chaperone HemW [Bacillota bacterium]
MKDVALYIHIPFCKQKCLYCDFPSFSGKEKCMMDYTRALSKEIRSLGDLKIKTIFIGGGTPTYLPLEAWKLLKESIFTLNLHNDLEFTVEGNPGTFSQEKLEFFLQMGINRLSIGLQSYDDVMLKRLGRIHNIKDFNASYRMARTAGFKNINIDLMFGLPNQSIEQWTSTLEQVISLNPEHLSCYSLIIEEGTPFYAMYESGNLRLPDEDNERIMYQKALEILKAKGYHQYEISNFSKTNKECKHNLVYWNLGDYHGCGAAAHSYINGVRYRNVEDVEKYIHLINNSKKSIVEVYENSLEDDMEEFMFMGLRKTEGISISEFSHRFKKDIFQVYGDVINKYINLNLLIKKEDKLYLSAKGIEVSNVVMSDFIL